MIEDRNHNPKLLIGIAGGLIAVIAIFLAYQWFIASNVENSPTYETELTTPAQVKAKPAEAVPLAETEPTQKLIEEDILQAAAPENASIAKEEIAKLDDIQLQLAEQENTLKAQHADADQLLKLKEEQIKLLEAQLAQTH